jgi:hypothetical protein
MIFVCGRIGSIIKKTVNPARSAELFRSGNRAWDP